MSLLLGVGVGRRRPRCRGHRVLLDDEREVGPVTLDDFERVEELVAATKVSEHQPHRRMALAELALLELSIGHGQATEVVTVGTARLGADSPEALLLDFDEVTLVELDAR